MPKRLFATIFLRLRMSRSFPKRKAPSPRRHLRPVAISKRDFALGVMGAALLVWAAMLVARVPIVNEPKPFAKAVPTRALKASMIMSPQELISTWVIDADSDAELASARQVLEPDELEARDQGHAQNARVHRYWRIRLALG